MNSSFKSNPNDKVDPKLVPPSRHSVFIRGFPSNTQLEEVRNFFKNETQENCKIDFFSYSDDREKLFLALRFDTHEKAADVLENWDGRDVLGHRVEISWFKDLRKARKKLIEEERYSKHRSRSPADMSSNQQSMMGNNNRPRYMGPTGPLWAAGLMPNQNGLRYMGMGGNGRYGRHRGGGGNYRRSFPNRGGGVWRRARLSPYRRHRSRRQTGSQSHSRSRSRSRSYSRSKTRSRSRSRSVSVSSKSRRRSYSSYSSRDRESVRSGVGHDSVHKYRNTRSSKESPIIVDNIDNHTMDSDDSNNAKQLSNTVSGVNPNPVLQVGIVNNSHTSLCNVKLIDGNYESENNDENGGLQTTGSDSSASSQNNNNLQESINDTNKNGKKHKKKLKRKTKKKRTAKKSKDSEAESSESCEDERNVSISKDESSNKNGTNKDELNNQKLIQDSSISNLNNEDQVSILTKKESLEKLYKKDCETISCVAKLFLSKNHKIEEEILTTLKSLFSEIGDKYVDDLRTFITNLNALSSNNNPANTVQKS